MSLLKEACELACLMEYGTNSFSNAPSPKEKGISRSSFAWSVVGDLLSRQCTKHHEWASLVYWKWRPTLLWLLVQIFLWLCIRISCTSLHLSLSLSLSVCVCACLHALMCFCLHYLIRYGLKSALIFFFLSSNGIILWLMFHWNAMTHLKFFDRWRWLFLQNFWSAAENNISTRALYNREHLHRHSSFL